MTHFYVVEDSVTLFTGHARRDAERFLSRHIGGIRVSDTWPAPVVTGSLRAGFTVRCVQHDPFESRVFIETAECDCARPAPSNQWWAVYV